MISCLVFDGILIGSIDHTHMFVSGVRKSDGRLSDMGWSGSFESVVGLELVDDEAPM